MLVTTLVAVTFLTGSAAGTWNANKGVNCYDGHGATDIDTFPIGNMTLADCEAKCNEDCTAVTVMTSGETGICWRRRNIDLSKCQTKTKFDTYVKRDSPPSPSPVPPPTPLAQFPTTVPAFMKALVEGLISDQGTDAKKCEGDAAAFASSMEQLAQTAVGSVKAVAAAIEEAKERCAPVAHDAEQLAASLLGDVFHPGRFAKNFQSTRTDVLTEIGSALEALAKKDFKGAGDNAGKLTRRLIEGAPVPPDANSVSYYVRMGEMNCYTNHGAVDLESVPGHACGKMSLRECEQKCDELSGCQGVTVSPTSDPSKVLCYRRGSINVGQCDHEAVGYDIWLNKNAQLPEASNTVASAAMYVVTYWGAAAMSQESGGFPSVENGGDFLEGLLEGLMSDGTDFSDCKATIPVVGQALETAKQKVAKGLAATVAAVKAAKESCGTVAGDVMRLAKAAFYDLLHPDHVVQNFQDMQEDILMDLGELFIALAKNDYSAAGDFMGMAIRRVIEGKQAATVIV